VPTCPGRVEWGSGEKMSKWRRRKPFDERCSRVVAREKRAKGNRDLSGRTGETQSTGSLAKTHEKSAWGLKRSPERRHLLREQEKYEGRLSGPAKQKWQPKMRRKALRKGGRRSGAQNCWGKG